MPIEANLAPEPHSLTAGVNPEVTPTVPDWASVATVLRSRCGNCHNDTDAEAGFSVSSFASLSRGSAKSVAYLPGRSVDSHLVRLVTGQAEPKMPPDDEPPLLPAELATLVAWIDAGGHGPAGETSTMPLIVPRLLPTKVKSVRSPR